MIAGTAFGLGAVLTTVPSVSSAVATPARSVASAPSTDSAATGTADTRRPAATRAVVRRAFCHGRRATIVGNARRNRIVGTRHRDVIAAGRGGDVIVGRGGPDIICGGPGPDVINGGRGRDRIFGDRGGDILEGGRARDRLYGGTRRDVCSGELREHRYHFGCESHRDPFGNLVSPPPTQGPGSAGFHPKRVSRASKSALPRAAVSGYLQAPLVADCENTYSNSFIRFGSVSFQTYYTNPGIIALRPIYITYDNGWQQQTAARDWQLFQAPADGQVYSVDMGTADLPSTYTPGTKWGWEAYWWDGTQWNNYAVTAYGGYNWVGRLGLVSASNAVVCA